MSQESFVSAGGRVVPQELIYSAPSGITADSDSKRLGPICGSCVLFDQLDAKREPAGTGKIDLTDNGGIVYVAKGFCRGPLGLLIGVRHELQLCSQPQGIYVRQSVDGDRGIVFKLQEQPLLQPGN